MNDRLALENSRTTESIKEKKFIKTQISWCKRNKVGSSYINISPFFDSYYWRSHSINRKKYYFTLRFVLLHNAKSIQFCSKIVREQFTCKQSILIKQKMSVTKTKVLVYIQIISLHQSFSLSLYKLTQLNAIENPKVYNWTHLQIYSELRIGTFRESLLCALNTQEVLLWAD